MLLPLQNVRLVLLLPPLVMLESSPTPIQTPESALAAAAAAAVVHCC
jgi:hypothetical protein